MTARASTGAPMPPAHAAALTAGAADEPTVLLLSPSRTTGCTASKADAG